MSKKNNNQNQETVNNTPANVPEVPAETPEVAKAKLGTKIVGGLKKHGKKIAAGAALVVGGAIAYGLGVKKGQAASDSEDSGVNWYELDAQESEADYVAEN